MRCTLGRRWLSQHLIQDRVQPLLCPTSDSHGTDPSKSPMSIHPALQYSGTSQFTCPLHSIPVRPYSVGEPTNQKRHVQHCNANMFSRMDECFAYSVNSLPAKSAAITIPQLRTGTPHPQHQDHWLPSRSVWQSIGCSSTLLASNPLDHRMIYLREDVESEPGG